MSRPDDVTAEAWEQAETHRQLWARGPCTIKEAVARAITAAVAAEREACAVACEKEAGEAKRNGLPHVAMGANWCTASIRARSTP